MTSLEVFDGVRPYRICADEFARMVDAGVFGERRVELVGGELLEMSPSHRPHGQMISRLNGLLWSAYRPDDWVLLTDTYVGLRPETVRAPDICVVKRSEDPGTELSAADVYLAIEVSHTTLGEDLGRKRRHYAEAGIRNYWVVDVDGGRVYRFAQPTGSEYLNADENPFGAALSLPGIENTITIG